MRARIAVLAAALALIGGSITIATPAAASPATHSVQTKVKCTTFYLFGIWKYVSCRVV